MALCCYRLVSLSAAKEEFPEGGVNRRGYFALALECNVFSSTGDDTSKNKMEYGEMWWEHQKYQKRTLPLSWKLEGRGAEGHFSNSFQKKLKLGGQLGKVTKLGCLHTVLAAVGKTCVSSMLAEGKEQESRQSPAWSRRAVCSGSISRNPAAFFLFVFSGCQVFKWIILTPSWDCAELQPKLQHQQDAGSLLPGCCPLLRRSLTSWLSMKAWRLCLFSTGLLIFFLDIHSILLYLSFHWMYLMLDSEFEGSWSCRNWQIFKYTDTQTERYFRCFTPPFLINF